MSGAIASRAPTSPTVLPLDDIAVRGTELTFVDLAVQHQYAPPRRYRADWLTYDDKAGKPSGVLGSTSQGQPIPTEPSMLPSAAMCSRASRWRAARLTWP